MSELRDAFDALVGEHRRIRSPVPDYLRPGRPESEVRERLAALGLAPSDEVVEYFTLQDGLDEAGWIGARPPGNHGYLHLFPFYDAPPRDVLERRYRVYRDISQRGFGPAPMSPPEIPEVGYWAKSWFPVFVGSYSYAADCRGGSRSLVWGQASHDGYLTTVPLYASLADLLLEVAERIRAGVISWSDEGYGADDARYVARDRHAEEQGSRLPLEAAY